MDEFLWAMQKLIEERFKNVEAMYSYNRLFIFVIWGSHADLIGITNRRQIAIIDSTSYSFEYEGIQFFNIADPKFDPEIILDKIDKCLKELAKTRHFRPLAVSEIK